MGVLEGGAVGGVWVFTGETEDDVIGREPGRRRVHSSMYSNLRTNLPREASSRPMSRAALCPAALIIYLPLYMPLTEQSLSA